MIVVAAQRYEQVRLTKQNAIKTRFLLNITRCEFVYFVIVVNEANDAGDNSFKYSYEIVFGKKIYLTNTNSFLMNINIIFTVFHQINAINYQFEY